MASDTTPLLDSKSMDLLKGEFCPASSTAIRGPCPFVNSLANHGYISRDGRNIHQSEFSAGARAMGISSVLAALLTGPIYLEYKDPKYPDPQAQRSALGKLWFLLRNPWALIVPKFGLRSPGQVDSKGQFLNLDELARPGIVEHDVSLSRHDFAQGDNIHRQADLIEEMLRMSKDGEYITIEDLASFRKQRIAQQMQKNPGLTYGDVQHKTACGEIGLVCALLGDGQKVKCEYVRAFFKEERFPFKEGWSAKRWFGIGMVALIKGARKVAGLIGAVKIT